MTDLESEFLSVSERRFKKWLMDDVAKYDLFGKLQLKKKCKELSRAWMLSIVYYAPLLPVSSYPGHCLLQQQGERGTGKMAVFALPSPTGLALKCLPLSKHWTLSTSIKETLRSSAVRTNFTKLIFRTQISRNFAFAFCVHTPSRSINGPISHQAPSFSLSLYVWIR